MVEFASELLRVAGHTLVIYLFLIVGFTLLGRRGVSQITFIELAVIMVLGSAVETAMVAGDTRLVAGLTSAATLLVANRLLGILVTRWPWLRRRVIGGPIILVRGGAFVEANLRRAGLTEADVLKEIRGRGYGDLESVRFAVREVDGSTTVVPLTMPRRPRASPPESAAGR